MKSGKGDSKLLSVTEQSAQISQKPAYLSHPYWINDTLSEYYAEDLKDFTVDDSKYIRSDSRRELRHIESYDLNDVTDARRSQITEFMVENHRTK